ncbi:MAG: glycosyltransferase family 2 protein, partial [Methanobacterium sp.]
YLTRRERLKIAPSLLMTEILTWGYSGLSGVDGIKYKSKAVREGLRMDVVKIESDGKELLRSMDWEIPEGQLMYNSAARTLKKAANWIYRKNYERIK